MIQKFIMNYGSLIGILPAVPQLAFWGKLQHYHNIASPVFLLHAFPGMRRWSTTCRANQSSRYLVLCAWPQRRGGAALSGTLTNTIH